MKKKILIIGLLISVITVIFVFINNDSFTTKYELDDKEINDAYDLLYNNLSDFNKTNTYYDFLDESKITYNNPTISVSVSAGEVNKYGYDGNVYSIGYKESLTYSVTPSVSGYYEISPDYYIEGSPLTNYQISVMIDNAFQYDESENIEVPLYWKDSTKEFPVDSYGDQAVPTSNRIDGWNNLNMYNNEYETSKPLLFYFEGGITTDITITLLSSTGRLALGNLYLNSRTLVEDYSSYIANYSSVSNNGQTFIEVNSIDYVEKNSSYIRMTNLNDELAQPYNSRQKLLNIIDGSSWSNSGQSITYNVEVEETGLYDLSLHYQNKKDEYSVFRTILINGEVPFAEFENYEFPYTGSEYKNETLKDKDGNNYQVYLEKGTHTLTLRADTAPLYETTSKLQLIIDHINQLSLEVLKITGSDIDEDRTWDITMYIPAVPDYLDAYEILLKDTINQSSDFSDKGANSASISYLSRALGTLAKVQKKPAELPLYLDELYSGSSSINQLLGQVLSSLTSQPMSLDRIYLTTNDHKLPKENSNFFVNFKNGFLQLWDTFFSSKYKQSLDDDVINVWVSRPMTHINILQRMIDADYNLTADRKVVISSMPDSSKLTLAVAAGNAPDVVLGLPSHMPYDLAIRGGMYDLTNFDDFYTVAGDFAPGTLLSFVLSDEDGDAFYALPETLNFNLLAYREDIFNSLGVSTELDTWEDMIGILPTLQRYGMNYFMPISQDNSTKWFYQTAPLILQNGGKLYSDDGLSVAINSPEAVEGLDRLTRMFTERSLPTNVPLFYSEFRSGTLPVGTIDFATYLQLKNAAPEIVGKWSLKLPLGTERVVDGETIIDRTYISSGTSVAILQDANEKEECWEFLKWWLSNEVQTEYGYTLQSTYGPEYLWLSSNLNSVAECQIDTADKELIIESLDYIVDVVRNPGQYMVERSISNIWTATVLSGDPLRVEIDSNVITMNREISRKMLEFGYIDSEGKVLKAYYTRDVEWVIEQIKKYGA